MHQSCESGLQTQLLVMTPQYPEPGRAEPCQPCGGSTSSGNRNSFSRKNSLCNCIKNWVRVNGIIHKNPGSHIFRLWNSSTLKTGEICKILHQPKYLLGFWCLFKGQWAQNPSENRELIKQISQQSCWMKAVYWGYSANGRWKRSSNET